MFSSTPTGSIKKAGGEGIFLVDAVPQASFITLGQSLGVASASQTDKNTYDCAEDASQSSCEQKGVKGSSAPKNCSILGALCPSVTPAPTPYMA